MPTLYSALQRGRMMFWIFLPEFVGSARLDPSWPDIVRIMLKTDMSSLMHNFFADTSYFVIWNTTVVFVPYMVSTVYTIFFFNINMLSVHQDHITISLYIFRKAIPHHHRRLSHHADAPGPLGGRRGLGEVWSSIGMKRKDREGRFIKRRSKRNWWTRREKRRKQIETVERKIRKQRVVHKKRL